MSFSSHSGRGRPRVGTYLRVAARNRTQSFILIDDGFDELEVISFLHKFRQKGLPIKSVSLFDSLVVGRQGVGLQADYELADSPIEGSEECLLILPAGGRNGDMLRRDARVKSLLQKLSKGKASFVVTDGQSSLATDVDRLLTRPLQQPTEGQDLGEFVDSLTDKMV
jgi:putative intracellular protease/amidase